MKPVTSEQLDNHVREIVQWHFSPETGTPFWLDFAKTLDWDPLKEIQTYQDLDRFGFFQDEWLRGGPVRRWVPKGLADRPVYVFETGGSTGIPKSRIAISLRFAVTDCFVTQWFCLQPLSLWQRSSQ